MSPEMNIRPATAADLPALGRLGASLMRAHHAFDSQRFMSPGRNPEAGYASFLRTQLSDDEAVVLVAEQDGAVVGYVYAALEPMSWKELRGPAGFIHDVVVEPSAQRQGTGSALLNAALEWMKSRGAPRAILGTAARNTDAQRLFERLGFRRTMIEMTQELAPNAKG
jgi:ribosomal protein S18 acetylase RimI-like enzyme